jgi:PKD repeat protein
MKKVIVFLFVLVILISVSGFQASQIGDLSHSINTEYAPSDYIKGWINISLVNEPADSLFEIYFDGSYDDSRTLIGLLELNNAVESDTCTPQDCMSDYFAFDESDTKEFDLGNKESKIIGFKLMGDIKSINSIEFAFESNAISSCSNQLEVDFLNDGIIDIQNEKVLDWGCSFSKSNGCFDDAQIPPEGPSEGLIGTTPYCQKIRLYNFPGFRLGAWVKNISSGNKKLTMELYDGEDYKADCELPTADILPEGGEVYCNIDYLVKEPKDYYVCIYSNDGTGAYKIQGCDDPENRCGFHDWPYETQTATASYNISAEGRRFDSIGHVNVASDLFPPEDSLETLAEQYLKTTYGSNMDCPDTGCIIPIRFFAQESQSITVKDLFVNYNNSLFSDQTERNFYNLTETPAIINMDFQKLYLDNANFSVPSDYDDYTFTLNLNGTEIFSEEISIERIPIIKRLIPTATAFAFPTEFKVIVEEFANITEYKWNFGDGGSKTTTTNTVTHTYATEGQYKLNITITDLYQRSSFKTFDVTVGSPEEIVNDMLGKMLNDLGNVITQIEGFDLVSQKSLKSALDIDSLDTTLATIQVANASASTSSDYKDLLTALLGLVEKIPQSVNISESSDLISFFPDEDIIDLDILEEIGGGSYDADDEDTYIDAVLSWNQQHMETKISVKGFAGMYGQTKEPILKVFNLKIKKLSGLDYNPYLIFLEFDNLKFKEDYSETEESGYIFIDLTEGDKTISFSTTEDISFIDLPVFISPEISKLGVVEPSIFDKEGKGWKWALFILIVFLLALIGVIVYIILQVWYKKKYENYLFKNKNELYNLVTYVQHARKKGLKRHEIANKLRKTGWSAERIKYVLKKHAGKRTGMLEIPVENVLHKFKKRTSQSNQRLGRASPNHKPTNHNQRAVLGHRKVKRRKFFKK